MTLSGPVFSNARNHRRDGIVVLFHDKAEDGKDKHHHHAADIAHGVCSHSAKYQDSHCDSGSVGVSLFEHLFNYLG